MQDCKLTLILLYLDLIWYKSYLKITLYEAFIFPKMSFKIIIIEVAMAFYIGCKYFLAPPLLIVNPRFVGTK